MKILDSAKTLNSDLIKDSQGSRGNLLSDLQMRVEQTLARDANKTNETISPEKVRGMIAQFSQQPLAGMQHNILV